MTIQERKKQLRSYKFWFFWGIFCIVSWIPFFTKTFGAEITSPVGGVTSYLSDLTIDAIENPIVIEVEEEIVEEPQPEIKYEMIGSTAYYNKYSRKCASDVYPKANHTIAGMVAWLGKEVELYRCNKDGSVGDYMGTYKFEDTGYGRSIHKGNSKILKGRSIGDIEAGYTIDIYMDTYSECEKYGRRNVYMVWK